MCLENEQQPSAAQRAWKAKRVWKSLKGKNNGVLELTSTYPRYETFIYSPGRNVAEGVDSDHLAGLHCFLRREDAEVEAAQWGHETVVVVTITGDDILAVGEFATTYLEPHAPCVRVRAAVLSKTEHTRALCALRAKGARRHE